MEVDEDGSISVNVRSHARGYVVADEIVVAKGITMGLRRRQEYGGR